MFVQKCRLYNVVLLIKNYNSGRDRCGEILEKLYKIIEKKWEFPHN